MIEMSTTGDGVIRLICNGCGDQMSRLPGKPGRLPGKPGINDHDVMEWIVQHLEEEREHDEGIGVGVAIKTHDAWAKSLNAHGRLREKYEQLEMANLELLAEVEALKDEIMELKSRG